MSVEAVERKNGKVFRVRWRDEGGQARSKVIGRKSDATAFEAEVIRAKRMGSVTPRKLPTVKELADQWWDEHVVHLAARTQKSYAGTYDRHVLPYLGSTRSLTAAMVYSYVDELRANGVGEPTIYRALILLCGIYSHAVKRGRVPANPVRDVERPQWKRAHKVTPLTGGQVYDITQALEEDRDKAIVIFLAYAGLRPSELAALQPEDIRPGGIIVDKALGPDGEIKAVKNEVSRVVIDIPITLSEWVHVFPLTSDTGLPFKDTVWQGWHKSRWLPAIEKAGLSNVRPYDLRHTFVSRLIQEGKNILHVAEQAGHSPNMTLSVYGHLFP